MRCIAGTESGAVAWRYVSMRCIAGTESGTVAWRYVSMRCIAGTESIHREKDEQSSDLDRSSF
jgi:hypothetical protein